MHRTISAIVMLGLLQACVFKFPNVDVAPSANRIAVQDLRPATEKETAMFSYYSFSCAFGIQRYGDEQTAPKKMDVLRQRVYEKYKEEGIELKVNHFVVYQNLQASSRGMFWGPAPYMIAGYAVKGSDTSSDVDLYDTVKDVQCDPKEAALGAFSPDEYSGKAAFVVYLDITVKGKRVVVRHVGEPAPATIDAAIVKAL